VPRCPGGPASPRRALLDRDLATLAQLEVWARWCSLGQYLEVPVSRHSENLPTSSWADPHIVDRYLARMSGLEPRAAGEEVLATLLPELPRSVLDLGCGDGRLTALVLEQRPGVEDIVAVDSSPAMLGYARRRFTGEPRVTIQEWNLADPLTPLGRFDVVVAGFSIHHLDDQRKKCLFSEVARQLNPDGLFANLEVVASATPELHRQFLDLIGRAEDDPEDRLANVEDQLRWMREAGLTQVDCLWRWRGFALLAGRAN
jgi:tRNA (cmo5U34)-methyltransferase